MPEDNVGMFKNVAWLASNFPMGFETLDFLLKECTPKNIGQLKNTAESNLTKDMRSQWITKVTAVWPPTLFPCDWLEGYIYKLFASCDYPNALALLSWYLIPHVETHEVETDGTIYCYKGLRRAYFPHRALQFLFFLKKKLEDRIPDDQFSLLMHDIIKKHGFLYWSSSEVHDHFEHALGAFCDLHDEKPKYWENEWIRIERMIHLIHEARDYGKLHYVKHILRLHDNDDVGCEPEQTSYSRAERIARLTKIMQDLEEKEQASLDDDAVMLSRCVEKYAKSHGQLTLGLSFPRQHFDLAYRVKINMTSTDTRDANLSLSGMTMEIHGGVWGERDPQGLWSHQCKNRIPRHALADKFDDINLQNDGNFTGIVALKLCTSSAINGFTWNPFGDLVRIVIKIPEENREYHQMLRISDLS